MIIAGTGHRPERLGGYTQEVEGRLVALALASLQANRPDKVISGMAAGWDQALAQAAIHLHIPLLAAVPFEGQEKRWPEAAQRRFHRILKAASEVVFVKPAYSTGVFILRDKWMIDHADSVLALYDGTPLGGTFLTIGMAEKRGKPVTNLWQQWLDSAD